MDLGAFSISLTVKDLAASLAFYEKLGFASFGGDSTQGWTILKNGDHIIGLFQGMFDKNMLTFILVGTRTPRMLLSSPTYESFKSNSKLRASRS